MSSFSSWFMPPIGSSSSSTLGLERQRAAELDALAQAVGQRGGRLLAQVLQLQELDDLLAGLAVARSPRFCARPQ